MTRMLVKFAKKSEAVFLSHRETMRCLERALRRSELPLSYTSGFKPRPRVSFSPALPLGVAAEAEYIEVGLEEDVNSKEALEKINQALPRGLEVREIHALSKTMPRLSRWVRYGLYRVPVGAGYEYLLLSLSGVKQGRLRDALEKMASQLGMAVNDRGAVRVGLYASPDEVFEDAQGIIHFFDGETGELRRMSGE